MWPIHLQHPTMAILGMARVSGSVLPVAELQARWAARVMAGKLKLPRYPDMKKEVNNTIQKIKKNTGYYVVSNIYYATILVCIDTWCV